MKARTKSVSVAIVLVLFRTTGQSIQGSWQMPSVRSQMGWRNEFVGLPHGARFQLHELPCVHLAASSQHGRALRCICRRKYRARQIGSRPAQGTPATASILMRLNDPVLTFPFG